MTLITEKFTTISIVHAPFESVLDACIGLARAQDNGAIVTPDVTDPPNRHYETQDRKADWFDWTAGYLVSSPKGRPDLTVIESPMFETLCRAHPMRVALSALNPAWEILNIVSDMENKSNQYHGFELIQDGQVVRFVFAKRVSGRWRWREEGTPCAWEEQCAYANDDIAQRLTREQLFRYVGAYGLDVQQNLIDRSFERSMRITGGSVMQLGDTRPRTDKGQRAYEKALSLGIGEPEPTAKHHAAQRHRFSLMNAVNTSETQANRAFNRLKRKDRQTLADVVALLNKVERAWPADLGAYEVSDLTLNTASNLADRLDYNHADSKRFRAEKKMRTRTQAHMMALAQTCDQTWGYGWSWEPDMVQIIRETITQSDLSEAEQQEVIHAKFAAFRAGQSDVAPEAVPLATDTVAKAAPKQQLSAAAQAFIDAHKP